jgi:hypothetical protein
MFLVHLLLLCDVRFMQRRNRVNVSQIVGIEHFLDANAARTWRDNEKRRDQSLPNDIPKYTLLEPVVQVHRCQLSLSLQGYIQHLSL